MGLLDPRLWHELSGIGKRCICIDLEELDKLIGMSVSDKLDEKKEHLLHDENEEV